MEVANIYISECKRFIAFHLGHADFDVIENNGNYWPNPPLCDYPLKRQVGGYSNVKSHKGRKCLFTLDLLECNTSIKIKPGIGNTVIKDSEIIFVKRITYKRLPKWAKAMAELLKETRKLQFNETNIKSS